MKIAITTLLLICSITIGFSQKNNGEVKRYGFVMDIPKDWQIDKDKEYTEISDRNLDITITLRELEAADKDELLQNLRTQVYKDVSFFMRKEKVDEKLLVETKKNRNGLEYLRLYLLSEPDEENEVMVYETWIFKNDDKAFMVSVIDFGEGVDPDNEYDMVTPKFWKETDAIEKSIRRK